MEGEAKLKNSVIIKQF